MMKNILVLSVILFFTKSNASHITIQLGKLEQEELRYLAQIAQVSNFKKLVITVIPGAQFSCEYKDPENFLDAIKNKITPSSGFINTKSILMYGFKAFFGTSLLSYITILYFIYRVYKIAKKLQILVAWIVPEQGDNSTHEALDLIEKMIRKKEWPVFTQQDYDTLQFYKKVVGTLEQLKIRWLFPCNQKADQTIDLLLTNAEKIR